MGVYFLYKKKLNFISILKATTYIIYNDATRANRYDSNQG
jgi:hypothetical protein